MPGLPPSPPFQPSDLDGQTGYPGPFNLAQPTPRTAIVERYYVGLTKPNVTLIAQAALAAPYAAIPVAHLQGFPLFLVADLGVTVNPTDVLRINRVSVNFQPPAGRALLFAGVHMVIVTAPGVANIEVPMIGLPASVAVRDGILDTAQFIGPLDLRGTEFNLGGLSPAFDEIDFDTNIAVVDGGGNAVLIPSVTISFEVWRAANQL